MYGSSVTVEVKTITNFVKLIRLCAVNSGVDYMFKFLNIVTKSQTVLNN